MNTRPLSPRAWLWIQLFDLGRFDRHGFPFGQPDSRHQHQYWKLVSEHSHAINAVVAGLTALPGTAQPFAATRAMSRFLNHRGPAPAGAASHRRGDRRRPQAAGRGLRPAAAAADGQLPPSSPAAPVEQPEKLRLYLRPRVGRGSVMGDAIRGIPRRPATAPKSPQVVSRSEWAEAGSNRRHRHFQCRALPAELSARMLRSDWRLTPHPGLVNCPGPISPRTPTSSPRSTRRCMVH